MEISSSRFFQHQPIYSKVTVAKTEDSEWQPHDIQGSVELVIFEDSKRDPEKAGLPAMRITHSSFPQYHFTSSNALLQGEPYNMKSNGFGMTDKPGTYQLQARYRIAYIGPQKSGTVEHVYSSDKIEITVLEPTEKELKALALASLCNRFSSLRNAEKPKNIQILDEFISTVREHLKRGDAPLRNELNCLLVHAILDRAKYEEAFNQQVSYQEAFQAMLAMPADNPILRNKVIYISSHSPTGVVQYFIHLSKKHTSLQFNWKKLESQWNQSLPILIQTPFADIEEFYKPTYLEIQELAKSQSKL